MAIAYLQHAGVLPNLQDADLIAKHGVSRHTFWTKVPNPDISKGRQRAKYKYLGDYKAMAIDTTFVRADMLRSQHQQAHPTKTGNGKRARRNSHGNVQRQKMVSIGWDSDTASDTPIASDESPKPEELLKLVEGFFEYYLGFPVEDKAISIWRGKPIDRKMAIPKHAGARYMRGSRKLRKQAQDVQEELSELEEEQSLANASLNASIVLSGSSDSDTVTGSDETAITEDEELAAMHAKLAAQLAKLGIQEDGASFEETHKLSKKQRKKQKREVRLLAQSQAQPVMQGIDGLEQVEEAEEEEGEIGINAYKGLDVSEANPKTGLFPVPAVEDPEKFIEPPTWIQQLVVQDPFIHTRNTTMNISPDTVDVIWKVSTFFRRQAGQTRLMQPSSCRRCNALLTWSKLVSHSIRYAWVCDMSQAIKLDHASNPMLSARNADCSEPLGRRKCGSANQGTKLYVALQKNSRTAREEINELSRLRRKPTSFVTL